MTSHEHTHCFLSSAAQLYRIGIIKTKTPWCSVLSPVLAQCSHLGGPYLRLEPWPWCKLRLTTTCNSSFRESSALFLPLWTSACMWYTYLHLGAHIKNQNKSFFKRDLTSPRDLLHSSCWVSTCVQKMLCNST